MLRLYLLLLALVLLAACGASQDGSPNREPTGRDAPLAATELPTLSTSTPAPTATRMPPAASGERVIVTADDPRIQYTGRIDFSDPKRPRFDWPAVTIEANFTGTSLGLLLQDGQNSYNVYINGEHSLLNTRLGQESYLVAEGLPEGAHSLRMVKRTETFYGTPTFLGLTLDPGKDLAAPPERSTRRIEFIGDSNTA